MTSSQSSHNSPACNLPQWAADTRKTSSQYMGVDLRRAQVRMAQQFLHRANVRPSLKQLRRKGVAECMATGRLHDPALPDGPPNLFLHRADMPVMANDAPIIIPAQALRRKKPLPLDRSAGVRIFPCQGKGQRDRHAIRRSRKLPAVPHGLNPPPKWFDDRLGHQCGSVLLALAIPNHKQPSIEIKIFEPKAGALGHSQPGSIHQRCHQRKRGGQSPDNLHGLVMSEDHRNPPRALRPDHITDFAQRCAKDMPVQKHQGVKRLILSGNCHIAFRGKPGEKGLHLPFPQLGRMFKAMKTNKKPNPVPVSLLGPPTVVPCPNHLPQPLPQARPISLAIHASTPFRFPAVWMYSIIKFTKCGSQTNTGKSPKKSARVLMDRGIWERPIYRRRGVMPQSRYCNNTAFHLISC